MSKTKLFSFHVLLALLAAVPVFCFQACGGGDNGEEDAAEEDAVTTDSDAADMAQDDAAQEPEEEIVEDADEDAQDASGEELETGWQEPVLWKSPIADYIDWAIEEKELALDAFDHALKELSVFDDRLYFGYGDWTENLGPVDIRYFDDPEADFTVEFTIEEESIDYYRIFSNTYYIPGVDAKEDGLLGNIFYKPSEGDWVKVRDLDYALHVLDIMEYDGALYACGGGCIDMDHYYAGQDESVIWKSEDGGDTWEVILEEITDSADDVARWERFVKTSGRLYCFGQVTTNTSEGAYFSNDHRQLVSGSWHEAGILPQVLVMHTHQFNADRGIVIGISFDADPYFTAYSVQDFGTVELAFLSDGGERTLDVFMEDEGQALFLSRSGAAYPDEEAAPFTYSVYRTTDMDTFEELLTFESSEVIMSIASWRESLTMGTRQGDILRSVFVSP